MTVVQQLPPWSRYVAIGDSFTEGLWDYLDPPAADDLALGPQPEPPLRGWADRLAESLSARRVAAGADPLGYANLAVRGRLLRPIVTEQLEQALDLRPDLVSVVGGGNDLLRPDADPDVLARRLEAAVVRLRAAGVDVLLATGMDVGRTPLIRLQRSRVAVFNAHVWSIARRHGAAVTDVWGLRSLTDWSMWAPDRIHLTSAGHQRVAQAALVALGLEPDLPGFDGAPPVPPRAPSLREDAVWARQHMAPWIDRHLHGRSSGDGKRGKRTDLVPLSGGPGRDDSTGL